MKFLPSNSTINYLFLEKQIQSTFIRFIEFCQIMLKLSNFRCHTQILSFFEAVFYPTFFLMLSSHFFLFKYLINCEKPFLQNLSLIITLCFDQTVKHYQYFIDYLRVEHREYLPYLIYFHRFEELSSYAFFLYDLQPFQTVNFSDEDIFLKYLKQNYF